MIQNKNIAIFFMITHSFLMSLGTVFLKILQQHHHITQIIFCYNLLICVLLLFTTSFKHSNLKITYQNIKVRLVQPKLKRKLTKCSQCGTK